jgi:alkanesulfonate monooxygenase SsuD/methylene tetrahydromethanopterin reductase-like flavin-dependent oxidoreductase (luciferase family)
VSLDRSSVDSSPKASSRPPFAGGSTSLRLYPHSELPAARIVEVFMDQAAAASEAGFDGIMTSEHHGGFAGYLPNPIQAAGWALEAMPTGWAAPCPLLLPLRPAALVVEELAWLAARHPGRVGVGVAAGSLQDDFDIMGLTKTDLTARFAASLRSVADALSGRDAGLLAGDPAVCECAQRPVPVLSAAMSATAVRRAAECGVGLLFDSLTDLTRCRELIDAFHEAGGTAPVVLIRRCWLGSAPTARHREQVGVYAGYASAGAQTHWDSGAMATGSAEEVATRLHDALATTGADALNLRVHAPGLDPGEVTEQIRALHEVRQLLTC